jgi:ubiquinone/menaquinone biosynthesis C-methylase UbiE
MQRRRALRSRREPGLGRPIAAGASGIGRRLNAMTRIAHLEGKRLLDVGCGNGAYTERLASTFAETVAIDVSEAHLGDFRARCPHIDVRILSVEQLDYPDRYFDVVVMIEVIEHLHDVQASLRQLHRVLKPDGVLVITAPNRLFPLETHLVRLRGRSFRGRYLPFLPWLPPVHSRLADARTYTRVSLRREVQRAGFRLDGVEYVMPPFDGSRFGNRFIRPLTDALERTPLRRFGVSIVASFSPTGS